VLQLVKEKKTIIFSDFDGTITERDVIVMVMEKFAPPEWVKLKDQILYERTISLKEGIEKLFGLIGSNKKEEIIDFVKKEAKLRSGFPEFVDFCRLENIELNVFSASLDFLIEPLLKDFKNKLKIFSNGADFSSEKISINYNYLPKNCSLCGTCGCCKVEIIEKYPKEHFIRVVIGDGLAELAPSKIADLVFARGNLIKLLEQEKISYIPFQNFHEVQKQLIKNVSANQRNGEPAKG